jgi:hypothetical protein
MACAKCNELLEEFIPAPLKSYYGKSSQQNIQ